MSTISAGVTTPTALSFSGDTTGAITFQVSGTVTAATITSAGNVGIGTATPAASFGKSLHLYNDANTGTVASNTYLAVESANRNAVLELSGSSTATNQVTFSDTLGTSVAAVVSSIADSNLFFRTGGTTERMRIDSSGNVGIGNTAANVNDQVGAVRPLLVSKADSVTTIAGSQATIVIGNADTTTNNTSQLTFAAITGANSTYFAAAAINCIFGARTNGQYPTGQLVFSTSTSLNSAPTEKMRIDNSGNVGIGGTAGADTKVNALGTYPTSGAITRVFLANGTIPSGTTSDAIGFNTNLVTQAASFTLGNLTHYVATTGTLGAGSAVTNQYGFFAHSSLTAATNNYGFYSNIASGTNRWNFYANGTAQNYFAGNTRTDGTLLAASAQTWDERLGAYRTENQVVIGGYANNGSYTSSVIRVQVERASSNAFYFLEARVSTGALRYGILGDGTVTTSDERRKKNITSVNDGLLSNLCKLRVVNYNWKTDLDADEKKIGLIAQEVEQVFPELVMVRYDGPNDDQEVKVLKTDSLVPMLIKAIQEQQTMIDELKAKVAALETK